MGMRHVFLTVVTGIGAWLLPWNMAHAEAVLYDRAVIIQGQQSFLQPFDITTAGTLTMTLTQVPWLDPVSDLTAFVTTASGVLGTPMGAGTDSFKVAPGMVYAHWYGDAQGTFNAGVVGVTVQFLPAVPLPGSLVLLLSGVALIFVWQRFVGSGNRGHRATNR